MSRRFGRRGNRSRRSREDGRRRVRLAVTVTLQVAVVAGVVGWAVPMAVGLVRAHPYFALEEVAIAYRGHLPAEAIRAAAGLRPGMSIWDVDAGAVQDALERLPWVRSARVTRRLPGRVTVRLREHRPAAILLVEGEPAPLLHYVAADGRVIAPVGAADGRDLPYVTGLDRAGVDSGAGGYAMQAAMEALRIAASHRDAIGVVSELHVDEARGLTLIPMRPAVPIRLGWGALDAKLARVAQVLPHWLDRAEDVRSVEGTNDRQVIVRLRSVPTEWGT